IHRERPYGALERYLARRRSLSGRRALLRIVNRNCRLACYARAGKHELCFHAGERIGNTDRIVHCSGYDGLRGSAGNRQKKDQKTGKQSPRHCCTKVRNPWMLGDVPPVTAQKPGRKCLSLPWIREKSSVRCRTSARSHRSQTSRRKRNSPAWRIPTAASASYR